MKQFVVLLVIIFGVQLSHAQVTDEPTQGGKPTVPVTRIITNRKDTLGFQHRDDRKDSISISYKYLDSVRNITLDSSINDFDHFFYMKKVDNKSFLFNSAGKEQ